MVLTKQGKALDEALALASRATKGDDPNLPSFLDTLATVHAAREEYEPALQSIGLAMRLDPGNLIWKIRFAALLAESGRPDRAKVELARIEAMNPKREQLSEEAWARLQTLRGQSSL
jgi:predicted Zn-dependent protease